MQSTQAYLDTWIHQEDTVLSENCQSTVNRLNYIGLVLIEINKLSN
jgi:hypothetical protein